jgi:hypothetical protein
LGAQNLCIPIFKSNQFYYQGLGHPDVHRDNTGSPAKAGSSLRFEIRRGEPLGAQNLCIPIFKSNQFYYQGLGHPDVHRDNTGSPAKAG